MGDLLLGSTVTPHEDCSHVVLLKKDAKVICHTECLNPPWKVPVVWNLKIAAEKSFHYLSKLCHFYLRPKPQCTRDEKEWSLFLHFLQKSNMHGSLLRFSDSVSGSTPLSLHKVYFIFKGTEEPLSGSELLSVAFAEFDFCKFYIHPPDDVSIHCVAMVSYQIFHGKEAHLLVGQKIAPTISTFNMVEQFASREDAYVHGRGSANSENSCSDLKFPQAVGDHHARVETCRRSQSHAVSRDGVLLKNYVRADPSYLKTLGQTHSGWIFGAIAELIDNSRDAKATRLDISIEMIYSKNAGKEIPVLLIIDDGHGMTHDEVMRMTCFGHKQPDTNDPDHIGRFGVGFKTGAMRLGRDALVLTQTANSRSIAFLSQSLNEGKDNLEIPIVSYCRKGPYMEIDTSVQSEASAKYNWKSIKEFSPFNKYLIGEKAGMFHGNCGTQIYIWNLDEWGSDYSLEWSAGLRGGSSFHQGDIFIRSRRIRSRPGQMSKLVPLDYSLRSYLEVIFLVPRMKIYVQGSLIKSRPLAKSLNNTVVETGVIMGKGVELTLGRSQLEWEQANSGIFLYWHGRLIEAYKRVGGMIHNADISRGVIGFIDVTDLMNDKNGCVWVLNNKQGFQDCEPYALLEEWLCSKVDGYLDKNVDVLKLVTCSSPLRIAGNAVLMTGDETVVVGSCSGLPLFYHELFSSFKSLFEKRDTKVNALYKPDHEWVQCDKCRKWRILDHDFDGSSLPTEWFCYMKPFSGSCQTPEQKVDSDIVTVSTKRAGNNFDSKPLNCEGILDVSSAKVRSNGNLDQEVKDVKQLPKRRKLLRGACKRSS